ncbi:DUF1707 SHOCT-like domain-containing protein [Pseudonocardia broussonetiae]|uniref:DUF1707 domain-containing protein n=1 Tax=Pseudonocardia broussonetiae TaxID=2736640 RepID=A0A6M6JK23_9PSEU|nr:DUF1707 domain-containing protein [Pseudonocardia broussonetiae]QJY48504.1 DUF1707 domain-containing protein [Pseudonocardia broussonetiae]
MTDQPLTDRTPTDRTLATAVRVSDAEREAVAERLRTAAADGRLTLAEADERQALAYAARFHDELAPLTADLPGPEPEVVVPVAGWRGLDAGARRRLAVHAAVGLAVAVLLLVRWIGGPVDLDGPRPWPVWPIFWIAVSVAFHYRRALRRAR